MAEIAVLTDEERDFLNQQRRYITKIKKVMRAMESSQLDFEMFAKKEAQAKDSSRKEAYQAEMTRVQSIITDCNNTIMNLKTELAALKISDVAGQKGQKEQKPAA